VTAGEGRPFVRGVLAVAHSSQVAALCIHLSIFTDAKV
jgi:hypothetical protein